MKDIVALTICGRDNLGTIEGDFSHIVSVWDYTHGRTGFNALQARFSRSKCLFLSFDDIIEGEGVLPTLEVIEQAIEFARDAQSLLIHCKAGISRSTAIAYAILCSQSGPGTEEECFEKLLEARPIANPNRLLVSLADAHLGRNGAMIIENNKRRVALYMNGSNDDEL